MMLTIFEVQSANAVVISMALSLLLLPSLAEGNLCDQSLPTIQEVDRCPVTALEWAQAAKRKRCDTLASAQKCSDPEKFVYHCLVNEKNNGLVEVCAPVWVLTGYCGFYDTSLGRIYNDVDRDCTIFEKLPCTKIYNSSEMYKYPGCFKTIKTSGDKKEQSLTFAEIHMHLIVVYVLVSLIVLGLVLTTVLCLWKSIRLKAISATEGNPLIPSTAEENRNPSPQNIPAEENRNRLPQNIPAEENRNPLPQNNQDIELTGHRKQPDFRRIP